MAKLKILSYTLEFCNLLLYNVGDVMRTLLHANSKDPGKLVHLHSLIRVFVICTLDNVIVDKVATNQITIFFTSLCD